MRVEVPEPPVMLVGLRAADSPADGAAVSATVPLNPLTEATVMVAVPLAPTLIVMDVVLVAIVKSWKVNWTVTACVIDPLVPVIVTM